MDQLSELRLNNQYRGSRYNLVAKCTYFSKKFVMKIYHGGTVIFQEATSKQELHTALAETHLKFKKMLDEKDLEFAKFCEDEKPGWAERVLLNKNQ